MPRVVLHGEVERTSGSSSSPGDTAVPWRPSPTCRTRSSIGSPGFGVTGLWLIGLWQRSRASAEIKRRRGDPDAVASAYAIDEYRIADDLGGEAAFEDLSDAPGPAASASRRTWSRTTWASTRAGSSSTRTGSSRSREPPFPAYSFDGPEPVAGPARRDPASRITTGTARDAAVVFRRRDTAERRGPLHLPRQRRHVVSRGTTRPSSTTSRPRSARR